MKMLHDNSVGFCALLLSVRKMEVMLLAPSVCLSVCMQTRLHEMCAINFHENFDSYGLILWEKSHMQVDSAQNGRMATTLNFHYNLLNLDYRNHIVIATYII